MKTRFAAGIALLAALLAPPLVAQEPLPPPQPTAGRPAGRRAKDACTDPAEGHGRPLALSGRQADQQHAVRARRHGQRLGRGTEDHAAHGR